MEDQKLYKIRFKKINGKREYNTWLWAGNLGSAREHFLRLCDMEVNIISIIPELNALPQCQLPLTIPEIDL